MRQFRDAAGVEWSVFETERKAPAEQRRDHLLPAEFQRGWLVFESATEKRRLAPVPDGWSELSEEALAGLCASATAQTRRGKRGEARTVASDSHAGSLHQSEQTVADLPESPIASELEGAEERLMETLAEVCDAPPVEALDTGELIRVEETLAIATEAAKEAVTLRRQRRINASAQAPVSDPEQRD